MDSETFHLENIDSGKRYVLPARDLGAVAVWGWAGIALSVIVFVFMTIWMATPAFSGFDMIRKGQPFGYALIAFASTGLIGMYYAAGLMSAGWAILNNRTYSVVEVRKGRLYSIEQLGWFKLRRNRPIIKIDSLNLARAIESKWESRVGGRAIRFSGRTVWNLCNDWRQTVFDRSWLRKRSPAVAGRGVVQRAFQRAFD